MMIELYEFKQSKNITERNGEYFSPEVDVVFLNKDDAISTSLGTSSPVVDENEGSWDW